METTMAGLYKIEELKNDLVRGVLAISYRALDGHQREIRATWNRQFIPEGVADESIIASIQHATDDEFTVWDMRAKGWRTLKGEGVFYVSGVETY